MKRATFFLLGMAVAMLLGASHFRDQHHGDERPIVRWHVAFTNASVTGTDCLKLDTFHNLDTADAPGCNPLSGTHFAFIPRLGGVAGARYRLIEMRFVSFTPWSGTEGCSITLATDSGATTLGTLEIPATDATAGAGDVFSVALDVDTLNDLQAGGRVQLIASDGPHCENGSGCECPAGAQEFGQLEVEMIPVWP